MCFLRSYIQGPCSWLESLGKGQGGGSGRVGEGLGFKTSKTLFEKPHGRCLRFLA